MKTVQEAIEWCEDQCDWYRTNRPSSGQGDVLEGIAKLLKTQQERLEFLETEVEELEAHSANADRLLSNLQVYMQDLTSSRHLLDDAFELEMDAFEMLDGEISKHFKDDDSEDDDL